MAYILVDVKGEEKPYGKKCAYSVAGGGGGAVSDFTKAAVFDVGGDEGGVKRTATRRAVNNVPKDELHMQILAIEYLRLRIERLKGFDALPPQFVLDVYGSLKSKDFLPGVDDGPGLRYVWNLMEKCRRDRMKYSPENLQLCYAYYFWLARGVERVSSGDGKAFLASLQQDIQKKLYLTEAQVKGAGRWLQYLEGMPKLKKVF